MQIGGAFQKLARVQLQQWRFKPLYLAILEEPC
jgi:hypothetical protein